ncbi:ankyrin repeat domain-containing protein [Streptomyces sp. NPDC052095]|uniref:ankyrin repeat domain-containing protein n=1 Tax=unclassified Streptomyces TaxID=2593676 RepID=UPI00344EC6C3
MDGHTLDGRLVAAVRAGDAETVRALLDEGARPDAVGADGLPLLCSAVAAYDAPVAEALVQGGADPDRRLPDGTTPLWRAVDGGSPAVFAAVLGDEPRLRLPQDTREALLALARRWYEAGAAEELRRRTGAPDTAVGVPVQDGVYAWETVGQVSLGGLVARSGHGAILTALEWAFRVLTPVDELIARAVGQPDEDQVTWWEVCSVLCRRRSRETWSAVTAHRHHPDPAHRRVVARYLWMRGVSDSAPSFLTEAGDLLAVWAAEETDGAVLPHVLDAFTEYVHPGLEAIGLRYADHPDPRVRREVPAAFLGDGVPLTEAARTALSALVRDPDATVRMNACRAGAGDLALLPRITRALLILTGDPDTALRGTAAAGLAASPDRSPAVADALWTLLDEDDPITRLEAAYGLALRDDPRTAEAIDRAGPLHRFDPDHRANALWDWKRRRTNTPAG